MLFNKTRVEAEPITDETISHRAYELWQERGCPEGDGSQDWQTAKEQLTAEAEKSDRPRPLRRLLARFRQRAAM